MEQPEMIALIERHLKAEGAGDIEGAVAVYTDDVEHDAVGFPGSPRTGKNTTATSTATSRRTSEPRRRCRSTATSPATRWSSSRR